MSVVYCKLNKTQMREYHKALTHKKPLELRLNRAQVASVQEDDFEDAVPIALNKMQQKQLMAAHSAGKPVTLRFTVSAMTRKSGGFIPLIPMLLSMLPGLLGAAPQILDGVKSGYENVGKLVGIKSGSSLNINGQGLIDFVEGNKKGSSLKIFGEGMAQKKATRPVPNTIQY